MRAWAVKGVTGIWLSSLEISRREVERGLCAEYTGAEWSWSPGYLERFEQDLADRPRSPPPLLQPMARVGTHERVCQADNRQRQRLTEHQGRTTEGRSSPPFQLHAVMPVAHALPVRNGFGIVCRLAVLPRVAINADRPKVLGYFLAAFRVPDDVISAPVAWLGRNKIDRRSAHVTGEALTAEQIKPCVSIDAYAAGLCAVAVHVALASLRSDIAFISCRSARFSRIRK